MSLRTTILVVFSLLFFGTPQIALGQWKSLNGPSGGGTGDIVSLNNNLFVATGAGGVYTSQDDGTTWNPVNNGLPTDQNIGNLTENNGVLYVTVTSRGVFKSEDNGGNWTQISNGIAIDTFRALLVDGDQIYAGDANGGITFSSNGGETWTFVEENIEGIQFQDFETFGDNVLAAGRPLFLSTDNGMSWDTVEIPGLSPNGAEALLASGNSFFVSNDGNIFRSDDNLQNWTQLEINSSGSIVNLLQFGARIFATTSQGVYYFSDDNGDSWSLVLNTLTDEFVASIFTDGNQIIMSTGEGLFSSTDSGLSWNFASDGLNAQIIQDVYVNGSNAFAGSRSSGIYRQDRNTGEWSGINTGLDALNARTINRIVENETGLFLATSGGVYFSSDNGDNWIRRLDPGINRSIQVLEYSNGVFLAGPGPNRMGFYISNDNGNIWDAIEIDILTTPTSFEALYFEGQDIIVGTTDGELYISRDLGDSWANISIDLPGFFSPRDIELIDGIIYVATARGIVFSEDFGNSWSFFKNFLFSTRDIEFNGNEIYAATSNGFFATNDSLFDWFSFNEGLDLRSQTDLFITNEELFLGTFGSSTWSRPISEIDLPDGPSPEDAFVTTWKTDNPGGVDDRTITIPVSLQASYDFNVDWGDGSSNENISSAISHTYEEPGVYEVTIVGRFPRIEFADQLQLIEVNQWGTTQWTSMNSAFSRCENLDVVAMDIPDLSEVFATTGMFLSCTNLVGNARFNDWDLSNVVITASMFGGAISFNQDIGNWNTSNVQVMAGMFVLATSFNQDISNWDVSKVELMSAMFEQATSFNQDIGKWNVSNVTGMQGMFNKATAFDQNLGDWDLSAIEAGGFLDLADMFLDAGLSTENYDATLIGWANLDDGESRIPQNLTFDGGNSQFCFGEEARLNLIQNFGWTIADAGLDPSCPLNATLSVTAFNLIDADNDVVLQTISTGDQININDLPTTNLNIQAVSTDDVESVRLELTGPQNNGRTENVAPYALFGDSNGDYAGNVFPLGDYGLIATPYSGNSLRGTVGTALEVSFSFVDEDPLCEGKSAEVISITDITQCDTFGGMVLIGLENFEANFSTIFGVVDRLSPNPETNVDYDGPSSLNNEPLEVFDITNLPGPGEYRAEIFDVDGCSVEVFFTLNGPDLPVVTLAPFDAVLDTDEPFILTGGSPEGGIYSGEGVTEGVFDPGIGAGNYEITYTFTNAVTNCTNSATQVLTVNPSVTKNSILAFVLVDADTNADIGPIMEGTVFDIASLPSNLNIRAETTDDVESVFMEISGGIVATRRENVAPYALFGDRDGDYFGNTFLPGSFTVSATPYTGNNLRGDMGSTLSISFTINGSQAAQNPIDLSIYPNPTTSSVMASFEEEVIVDRIQVFDVQGRLIRTYDAKRVKDGEGYRLNVNDMPAGSYFIRTQDTKGFNYQKQLVIER